MTLTTIPTFAPPAPSPPGDWLRDVLLDRGYLARLKGEAIKVYLALLERCGGEPEQSVTVSTSELTRRTSLSAPTVIDALRRLEALGLAIPQPTSPGRAKSYYVPDPPASGRK